MEGFSLNDIQSLAINRDDQPGSVRRKKELVSSPYQIHLNQINFNEHFNLES